MKKISLQGFGLFSDPANWQQVNAGEVIFQPGDFSDKMYIVVDGEVRLTQGENEIDVMKDGELFGEMGMVENRPRNGTVTAVTDSTLIPIDRRRFANLVREHPGFATRVMAIISTRLTRRTEATVKQRSMERELAIGREMQLSLLPQNAPQIPGWQFTAYYDSAWQVGGDFYDFIWLEDDPDKICLVIADVTGKGVPAALYMAMARTLIRAETAKGNGPARVLERVNELILNDSRSPLFLSVLYAVVNCASGRVIYASAGHNAPLCVRAGGVVEELPAHGLLLGAFSGTAYYEEETVLNEGDSLFLYTDGITEARDTQRRFYGEERLQKALAALSEVDAEEILHGVASSVGDFAGDVAQIDDMTMLLGKRVLGDQ